MELLIDSSIWIDHFRARTPPAVRRQALELIIDAAVVLAEPIAFEVRRGLRRADRARIEAHLLTVPMLETPPDLWSRASRLGQRCAESGLTVGSLDLLIAAVAIARMAEVVTFDDDFALIARVSDLKVRQVPRAE